MDQLSKTERLEGKELVELSKKPKYERPKLLRLTPHLQAAIGGCNSSGTHN